MSRAPKPDTDRSGTLPGLGRPDDDEAELAGTPRHEVSKGPDGGFARQAERQLIQTHDINTAAIIHALLDEGNIPAATALAARATMLAILE